MAGDTHGGTARRIWTGKVQARRSRKPAPRRENLLQRGSARESLVDKQSSNHQNHGARQRAEYLEDRSDLLHLGEDFYLILVHLGFGFVEEDGVILVHGEGALVNQEKDE